MFSTRLAAITVTAVAAGAAPAAGFDGGPVAFSTSHDDEWLATVMPDGSDYRRLVFGAQPAWSPNGKWIAYCEDGTDIRRVRPDGTDRRRVVGVPDGEATDPAWSPNGRRLAFTGTTYNYERLTSRDAVYVTRRDGSRRRVVRRDASLPSWSPDGRLIAFVVDEGLAREGQVATIRPNGRGFRVLRGGLPTLASAPQFSPNGRWLLFLTSTDDNATVAATRTNLVNVRTGALRRIPAGKMRGWPADVTWTPAGRIAFLQHEWTREDGLDSLAPTRLRTIRRDGSQVRTLAELPESAEPGGGLSWRQAG